VRLRTTFGMVLEARQAVIRADEMVEAAGVLLAEAVLEGVELGEPVETFRRAKAQRALAGAVLDGTEVDWYRDQQVSA
jgi:hypothetical protein